MDLFGRWLPLNFVYLAGAARMAGLDAEIYDAVTKDHGYPEIEQQFRRSAASYIASTALTSSISAAIKTLELAKRLNPRVVTILGGVHPTFCYEEIFAGTDLVDYIVCGEGESTLRELLLALQSGTDPAEVPGLAFRRGGVTIKTPERSLMESSDDLPAAWDLLDWTDYKYFVIPGSRLGAISTSRAGERFREPCKVAAELVHLYESYSVNVFLLTDEYPNSNRERWELFLDLVIERNLPVYLLMQTRSADIVRDRDIMWKYRKAGVVHIYVVSEAMDQAPPGVNDNGPEVTDGKLALDIIHGHGIVSEASFVIGGPDETRMSIEHTLKLAQYYNPDNAQFLPLTPWPYDDRYAAVKQYIKVHDYEKYNLIDPVIEPKQMSLLQVDVAIVDCYRRFYMGKLTEIITMKDAFKRDYLLKAMKLMMVSPFIIKKMGMGTLGKVPAKIEEMTGKKF